MRVTSSASRSSVGGARTSGSEEPGRAGASGATARCARRRGSSRRSCSPRARATSTSSGRSDQQHFSSEAVRSGRPTSHGSRHKRAGEQVGIGSGRRRRRKVAEARTRWVAIAGLAGAGMSRPPTSPRGLYGRDWLRADERALFTAGVSELDRRRDEPFDELIDERPAGHGDRARLGAHGGRPPPRPRPSQPPPATPPGADPHLLASPLYERDPWDVGLPERTASDEKVLLVGKPA